MSLIRPEVWADDAVAPRLADQFFGLLPTTTPTAPITSGTLSTNDGHGNPIPSARLDPASGITGVIVQAGLYEGQRYEARNISANSITMATAATSNVLAGTACVIAAKTVCVLVYDSTLALWMNNGL